MGAAGGVKRFGADPSWRRASTLGIDQVSVHCNGLIAEGAVKTRGHADEGCPLLGEQTHQSRGLVGLVLRGVEESVANAADRYGEAPDGDEAEENASKANSSEVATGRLGDSSHELARGLHCRRRRDRTWG